MSQQVLWKKTQNPKNLWKLSITTFNLTGKIKIQNLRFSLSFVQNMLGHLFLADKKKLWYLPNRKVAEGSRTRYTSSPSFLQFVGKAEGFDGGRNKDLEQNFFFGCPPALNDTTRISTSIIGTHFLDEQSTVLKDDLSLICGQLFAWKYVNTLLTNE